MDKCEKDLREFYYRSRRIPNKRVSLDFVMTTECNFRCSYCYEKKYKSESFNIDNAYKLIDRALEIEKYPEFWNNYWFNHNKKTNYILTFFGGECFLEIDKVYLIIEYFVKRCKELNKEDILNNAMFNVETNLYEFNDSLIKLYNDFGKYLKVLYVSIDGPKHVHDKNRKTKDGKPTFDVVYNNYKKFKELFPDIAINYKAVVAPNTCQYLYETYEFLKQFGPIISVKPALLVDIWPESVIPTLKKQFSLILKDLLKQENTKYRWSDWMNGRKWGEEMTDWDVNDVATCNVDSGIVLYPNGDLYLCHSFGKLCQQTDKYKIGDMEKGIYDSTYKFCETISSAVCTNEKEECSVCAGRNTSCGGCWGGNLFRTGSMEKDNWTLCNYAKVEQAYGAAYHYFMEKMYGQKY